MAAKSERKILKITDLFSPSQTRKRTIVPGPKNIMEQKQVSAARKSLQTLQPSSTSGQLVGNNITISQKKGKRKRDAVFDIENPKSSAKQFKPAPLVNPQAVTKDIVIFADPISSNKPETIKSSEKPCEKCLNRKNAETIKRDEKETQTNVTGATGVSHSGKQDGDTQQIDGVDKEAHELLVQEVVPEHYWRDLAEERRAALNDSLIENEQLHQKVDLLKVENQNLQKMADEAEYLAGILKELMEEPSDDSEEPAVKQNENKDSVKDIDQLKDLETTDESESDSEKSDFNSKTKDGSTPKADDIQSTQESSEAEL